MRSNSLITPSRKERKKKNIKKKKRERKEPPTYVPPKDMAQLENIYPPVVNPLKRVGRPLHYTPEQLAEKFAEYVKWCEKHPIVITRTAKGSTSSHSSPSSFDREEEERKPQMISVKGFCVWLGESESWWAMLDKDSSFSQEFLRVKTYIRAYCEENQAQLASAGVLKENIISRLLGLADKQNVETKMEGVIEYEVKFGE